MIRSLARVMCILACVAGLTACASLRSSAPRRVPVSVVSATHVAVDGDLLAIADLARKLKSLGATRETTIMVSAKSGVSDSVRKDISSRLLTAGFTRVLFVGDTRMTTRQSGARTTPPPNTVITQPPPAPAGNPR